MREFLGSKTDFGSIFSNVETVGLVLTGVGTASFKFVYPNLPLTVFPVDLNFWAKLCGLFLELGDGVNGINGPKGGILVLRRKKIN